MKFVTADPRSGGLSATIGSTVFYVTGGVMAALVKVAAGNTAWVEVTNIAALAPADLRFSPAVSTDPRSAGRSGSVGDVCLYYAGGSGTYLQKYGAGATDWCEFPSAAAAGGAVLTSRTISTTAPLQGGGDLSANRTLSIDTFTSGVKGAAPASGGGTANFLRADGTWAAPPDTGEANTGSNVGGGAEVFKTKTGVDFVHRSIIGTGGATVTENTNDVTIDTNDLTGIGLGFFGTGIDGDATMDGSTVVAGMTPALNGSNTKNFAINANQNYTRVRDYHFNNLTIDAGVISNGAFRVFVSGTLTLNGHITNFGINGVGGTTAAGGAGGAAGSAGTLPSRVAGGNGDLTTIGQAGGNRVNCPRDFTNSGGTPNVGANGTAGVNGRGGAGGAMVGTSAAAAGTIGNMSANNGSLDNIMQAMDGIAAGTGGNIQFIPGSGGGAGAGQGGNHGGSGGGSSGAALVVCAREIVGSGTLDVSGGNGGTIVSGNGGGGGGGGGGWVTVVIGTGSFPTVDVSGGNGGVGTNAGFDGGNGGVGVAKLFRIGA